MSLPWWNFLTFDFFFFASASLGDFSPHHLYFPFTGPLSWASSPLQMWEQKTFTLVQSKWIILSIVLIMSFRKRVKITGWNHFTCGFTYHMLPIFHHHGYVPGVRLTRCSRACTCLSPHICSSPAGSAPTASPRQQWLSHDPFLELQWSISPVQNVLFFCQSSGMCLPVLKLGKDFHLPAFSNTLIIRG